MTQSAERTDIPLRVLLYGDSSWADALTTAWGGVADQPLAIQRIDPADVSAAAAGDGSSAATLDRQVSEKMLVTDVAILPIGLLPVLQEEKLFTPLASAFTRQDDLPLDRLLPVLRQSVMRWAGDDAGVPLGSPQPSLLVAATEADLENVPTTWEEYLRLAEQLKRASGGPVVAEPLAGGAAAKMFLWRAGDAEPSPWLFDRETLEPLLTDEPYVEALETMRRCAEHYGPKRLTPGEVWHGAAKGELKLAIGWPAPVGDPPQVASIGDVRLATMPTAGGDNDRADSGANGGVMPDPDSPLGLISSRCRQTAAARRFLVWLAGGEGSEMVRSAAPQMTVLHSDSPGNGIEPAGGAEPAGYDGFLAQRLSSIRHRPTLRLHRYDAYLAALDRQVLACLDGEVSPGDALAAASESWKALTAQVGADRQAQAWRRAQGMRH